MSDAAKQAFLENTLSQAKANVLLFVGPLALVFAQLQTVHGIDSLLLKSVITVAIFLLLTGLYQTYKLRELVSFLIIREKQQAQDPEAAVGVSYIEWVEKVYSKVDQKLDADSVFLTVKSTQGVTTACLIGGYAGLVVCLLLVIWGSP